MLAQSGKASIRLMKNLTDDGKANSPIGADF